VRCSKGGETGWLTGIIDWFEVIGLNEPLDAEFVASKPTREAVGKKIEGRVVVWGRWMGQCERKWE
jgi:hypothetical protein